MSKITYRVIYDGEPYKVNRLNFEDGEIDSVIFSDDGSYNAQNWAEIDDEKLHLCSYSERKDSDGVEIYEGDKVYIAGYGEYEVKFPFLELYEAYPEGDIGKITGNIYKNGDKK